MKLLPSFILGVLASAIVGAVIYLRQRRESALFERRIVLLLETQQHQQDTLSRTVAAGVGSLADSHGALQREFRQMAIRFAAAVTTRDLTQAATLAQNYRALAGSIADSNFDRVMQSGLDDHALTVDDLIRLHKDLFPKGYEMAGQLRHTLVWIGGTRPESAHFVPCPAPEMLPRLRDLLDWWNRSRQQLTTTPRERVVEALAEFHHRFLSIHPFYDGNGRLARLLLARDARAFLGTKRLAITDKGRYYQALSAADSGNKEPLLRILFEALAS